MIRFDDCCFFANELVVHCYISFCMRFRGPMMYATDDSNDDSCCDSVVLLRSYDYTLDTAMCACHELFSIFASCCTISMAFYAVFSSTASQGSAATTAGAPWEPSA